MRTKIKSTHWSCPSCDEELNQEECDEIREIVQARGQIGFTCDECQESLTADSTDCPEGYIDINEDWVYD